MDVAVAAEVGYSTTMTMLQPARPLWTTILIAATAITMANQANAAELTDLSPGEQQTAQCMLAVAGTIAGVTHPALRFSTASAQGGPVQTFLDYTYRYQSGVHAKQTTAGSVELTDIIATKRGGFALSGHIAPNDPDVNDNDLGMLSITRRWQEKCGLDLILAY